MGEIKPSDLIAMFNKAFVEKWGYIGGKSGQIWTEQAQSAAEEAFRNGDNTYELTARYGRKWIGKRVADCQGLFAWAFKQLGGYMYHGSNTMWSKYTTAKGTLSKGKRTDGERLKPGTAVFKVNGSDYYHVGLYVGADRVIEARGTNAGVLQSPINAWHTWGELKGVNYGDTSASAIRQEEQTTTTQTVATTPAAIESAVAAAVNTITGGDVPMNTTNAVVTANGGVNLRTEPSTSATRLATIPKNTAIKATAYNDTWSSVEYDGKTGYVMTRYIAYNEASSTNATALQIIANIERELAQLKSLWR